jgi:hypothetical protein
VCLCALQCHAVCHKNVPPDCSFGVLQPIYLPPHAVSIPRTEVPMEAIIGVQVRRKETLSRKSDGKLNSTDTIGQLGNRKLLSSTFSTLLKQTVKNPFNSTKGLMKNSHDTRKKCVAF